MNEDKKLTPMKAIREKCIDCCCGSTYEVKLCTATRCPLYAFRLGKNPNIKPKELTEEQREELRRRGRDNRARQLAAKTAAEASDGTL